LSARRSQTANGRQRVQTVKLLVRAGKSTLLHCATGLIRPSEGTISVLGGAPGDRTLPGVGFVAQDAPLYRDFTADELLTMGDRLNADFDVAFGRERLQNVGVPLDRRVDRLSGGQRAQVALCLALAKRPQLLLLDEPLAGIDPLARREFLSALVDPVAGAHMTVILSSHLISDLERVCDHLLVLHSGHVQVIGETDRLLATHRVLIGPGGPRRSRIAGVERIISTADAQRQSTLLVRTNGNIVDPSWEQHDVTLEDVVLAYLAAPSAERSSTTRTPAHDLARVAATPPATALRCRRSDRPRRILPRHRTADPRSLRKAGLPDCLPQTIDSTVVADLYDPIATGSSGGAGSNADGDDSTEAITRCAQTAGDFFNDYQDVVWGGFALLILPMLVGTFWGAPLVAREIEHGTHRLVWTQGTSRLRWAATKFGLVLICVLAMTAIFAAMLNWWISPVMQTSGQRFDYIMFDIHGIVVFGYAKFALALGIFAGAVTGRLLPAMATTVVGFLATRLVVMLAARDHYLPTETRRISVAGLALGDSTQQWNLLHGDWIRSRPSGGRLGCPAGAADCGETLTMHPARHFWAFQTIETAIFVALAISLLLATVYWIRRRIG
jgi:ABC-2 type transport system ATP-binding protein